MSETRHYGPGPDEGGENWVWIPTKAATYYNLIAATIPT
jgi:hypothetical protein